MHNKYGSMLVLVGVVTVQHWYRHVTADILHIVLWVVCSSDICVNLLVCSGTVCRSW